VLQVSIKETRRLKLRFYFLIFDETLVTKKRRDLLSLIHGIKYAVPFQDKEPVFRKQHGIVRNFEFKPDVIF